MKINETQLEQVNDRIQALVRSNSFYGKKLEAAGMTEEQIQQKSSPNCRSLRKRICVTLIRWG